MIKITEANKDKINKFIQAGQKGCSVRLANYELCEYAIREAKKKPPILMLNQSDQTGLMFDYSDGEKFANSYNGIPEITHLRIKRRASGWFLVEAWRGVCPSIERFKITLSKEQSDIAVENFRHTYAIAEILNNKMDK
jgi:hypothetical protein